MLNFWNGIIHLQFLELSIITFRDIKMWIYGLVSQQYRASSHCTIMQDSLVLCWWRRLIIQFQQNINVNKGISLLRFFWNYDQAKMNNIKDDDRSTWLSKPTSKIMKKKRTAQTGDRGIWVIALGYAIKTRPGPEMNIYVEINSELYFVHILVLQPQNILLYFYLYYSYILTEVDINISFLLTFLQDLVMNLKRTKWNGCIPFKVEKKYMKYRNKKYSFCCVLNVYLKHIKDGKIISSWFSKFSNVRLCTRLGNFSDSDILLLGHETEDREYRKTAEETCTTVDTGYNEAISETTTNYILI